MPESTPIVAYLAETVPLFVVKLKSGAIMCKRARKDRKTLHLSVSLPTIRLAEQGSSLFMQMSEHNTLK